MPSTAPSIPLHITCGEYTYRTKQDTRTQTQTDTGTHDHTWQRHMIMFRAAPATPGSGSIGLCAERERWMYYRGIEPTSQPFSQPTKQPSNNELNLYKKECLPVCLLACCLDGSLLARVFIYRQQATTTLPATRSIDNSNGKCRQMLCVVVSLCASIRIWIELSQAAKQPTSLLFWTSLCRCVCAYRLFAKAFPKHENSNWPKGKMMTFTGCWLMPLL